MFVTSTNKNKAEQPGRKASQHSSQDQGMEESCGEREHMEEELREGWRSSMDRQTEGHRAVNSRPAGPSARTSLILQHISSLK